MFDIDNKIWLTSQEAIKLCKESFDKISDITEYNQQKILKAFIDSKVSESHFAGSTGYGYGDRGREVLDCIYAKAFETEDALVRHNLLSGTHAISTALFGVLRPGDKILSITGLPYDTMIDVIGINKPSSGSLKEFGIEFEYINFSENNEPNYIAINSRLSNKANFYKVIYIQRSRGYTLRKSISSSVMKKSIDMVKKLSPKSIILVDNCYGEFVEKNEPTKFGADLIVGSLIKNPGGGIAPCGGYIAGRKDLVEQCAYRLTAPGIGKEIGATLGLGRELFMGAFNAPHVVGEALKTSIFASALFELLGYEVSPRYCDARADIVQSIRLGSSKALLAFCRGIQMGSPIDSMVSPEPWDMPGYDSQVIMAAGTFTLGSSIELSADAPLKEPYNVWLQGGINFHSAKIGILKAADNLIKI